MPKSDYDVVILGAGFAGVAAAMELHPHKRVLLLEGSDRVGGRAFTDTDSEGMLIEHGAQYLGDEHTQLLGLIKELGLEGELLDFVPGFGPDPNAICRLKGRVVDVKVSEAYLGIQGLDRRAPLRDRLRLLSAMLHMDALCDEIDAEKPWKSPNAASLDQRSWTDLIRSFDLPDWFSDLLYVGVRGVWSQAPERMSLLYVLWYMKTNGGFTQIFNDQGGSPQQYGLRCGVSGLLNRWLERYTGDLRTGTYVDEVRVGDACVEVITRAGEIITASDVIVAVTPAVTKHIRFDPPLSEHKELLFDQPTGFAVKATLTYDQPWWRDGDDRIFACLNGQESCGMDWMLDASAPDGSSYNLVCFVHPEFIDALEPGADLSAAIVESAFRLAGTEAARNVRTVTYLDWRTQPGCRGGPNTNFGPGVLTTVREELYASAHGHVHFAAAEYSPRFTGYMEGALTSGRRTAQTILTGKAPPLPRDWTRWFKVAGKRSVARLFAALVWVLRPLSSGQT